MQAMCCVCNTDDCFTTRQPLITDGTNITVNTESQQDLQVCTQGSPQLYEGE